MFRSVNRGIICDLDGTLYKNDTFQAEFAKAFIDFISLGLGIKPECAITKLEDTRLNVLQQEGILPSEFTLLRKLGLDPLKWLLFSENVIHPEDYLKEDIKMKETIQRIRQDVWFDIATNSSQKIAQRILKCIGLEKEFDNLWTPDQGGMDKPSLNLYQHIAKIHRTPFNKILVIGDRWHIDIVSAESLDMVGKLVNGPEQAQEEMLAFIL